MKKIVIFLLAAILLVTCLAVAEQNAPAENETIVEDVAAEEITEETEEALECPESYFVSGYVMEIMEDGSILILTNSGEEIVIHLHDETINELGEILPGQYIICDYNGMMTRSIPAQISADHLYVYSMDGFVTEVIENEEERYFLMDTELHGIVMVRLPEDILLPSAEMNVRVYFNGAMTLSLPGQINALGMESIPNELARGEIEITDEPIAEETETPAEE
ncbi:MAG: hypothetical protein IKW00_09930 [Clostridia bacterium]|nr:hypothetical protein [Clostridia bacterium]